MSMIRCKENLHYYDKDKYDSCPFCQDFKGKKKGADDDLIESELGATVATDPPRLAGKKVVEHPARQRVEGLAPASLPSEQIESSAQQPRANSEEVQEYDACNLVVGWLVCMDGQSRGRDYRIKAGTNEVGGADDPEVDIAIPGDSSIAKRYHAEIFYDLEENVFYLIQKKSEAVKLNDSKVKRPTRLSPYDIVQFGQTRFVFVPLCSESFQWAVSNPT